MLGGGASLAPPPVPGVDRRSIRLALSEVWVYPHRAGGPVKEKGVREDPQGRGESRQGGPS